MVEGLLGRADIHSLANRLGVRPTKVLGQNFVHDANTIRRIVRTAGLDPSDVVLEIGPGLGSLTLGLLPMCRQVIAVEIDPVLADALPATIKTKAPSYVDNLAVIQADALRLTENSLNSAGVHTQPTVLVANLPYNVAVPIVLHVFSIFTSLTKALVMVQSEVAERMAAPPGSKIYGVPSVKVAWYAAAHRAGMVPRSVFWPVPNVDSELVLLTHRPPPAQAQRQAVFDVIDSAFAQRRKMLRSALAGWAGSPQRAQEILQAAGIDPTLRGEALDVNAYAQIAIAARA